MGDERDFVSVELDAATADKLRSFLDQDLSGLAALADACNNVNTKGLADLADACNNIDTRGLAALADACNNVDTRGLAALADACNNVDVAPIAANLHDLSSGGGRIQKRLGRGG